MSSIFVYTFDWDPSKARANLAKHDVSFQLATTIFADPLAATRYDAEHDEGEERWVTLGRAENGQYLVVVHTWSEQRSEFISIRIVSARLANVAEVRAYESGPSRVRESDMKDHYDFSAAARGKFFRPGAQFRLPVHLDPAIEQYLSAAARARGIGLAELANELLEQQIRAIESGKP